MEAVADENWVVISSIIFVVTFIPLPTFHWWFADAPIVGRKFPIASDLPNSELSRFSSDCLILIFFSNAMSIASWREIMLLSTWENAKVEIKNANNIFFLIIIFFLVLSKLIKRRFLWLNFYRFSFIPNFYFIIHWNSR